MFLPISILFLFLSSLKSRFSPLCFPLSDISISSNYLPRSLFCISLQLCQLAPIPFPSSLYFFYPLPSIILLFNIISPTNEPFTRFYGLAWDAEGWGERMWSEQKAEKSQKSKFLSSGERKGSRGEKDRFTNNIVNYVYFTNSKDFIGRTLNFIQVCFRWNFIPII